MSKVGRVALYEYRRHVLTRRFVLVILSVPGVLVLAIGLVALSVRLGQNTKAIGYVDLAGVLVDPWPAPLRGVSPDEPSLPRQVPILSFPTEEAARLALEQEEIQAYYVVPAEYPASRSVDLVYLNQPSSDATNQFWDMMQVNALRDLPRDVADRAAAGSNLVIRWPESTPGGGREFSQETFLNTFMPFIVGVAFAFFLLSASGYFLGAIVEEREARTMEVVMTSISPGQLLGGKMLAIIAVSATQSAGWLLCGWAAFAFAGQVLDLGLFQNLHIDPAFLWTMLAVSVPAFVLFAALMTVVGATVDEAHEAQQVMPMLILPMMAPLWAASIIMRTPDTPLAVALSLFPLTSVTTYSIRLGISAVPLWQILATVALSTFSSAAAVWLAGRALRLGMLRYGQRLSLGSIVASRSLGGESL